MWPVPVTIRGVCMLNMRLSAVSDALYERAKLELRIAQEETVVLLLRAGCDDNEVRAYMRRLHKEAN